MNQINKNNSKETIKEITLYIIISVITIIAGVFILRSIVGTDNYYKDRVKELENKLEIKKDEIDKLKEIKNDCEPYLTKSEYMHQRSRYKKEIADLEEEKDELKEKLNEKIHNLESLNNRNLDNGDLIINDAVHQEILNDIKQ